MLVSNPTTKPVGEVFLQRTGEGYRIDGEDPIETFASDDTRPAVRALYHAAIKHLVGARQDLLWLHAGVMARDGRAVLLCGPTGQGKSTLVAQLATRGWDYLSDEIAPIDAERGSVFPFPVVPYRRVNDGMQIAVTDDLRRLRKVLVDVGSQGMPREPVAVATVYFVSYAPTFESTRVVPCAPGEAVLEMLRNSLNLDQPRTYEISGLCGLMRRARAAQLVYRDAQDAATHIANAHQAQHERTESASTNGRTKHRL
jgi:energy-coupling factor transporter ATP-binding protein EcfA2